MLRQVGAAHGEAAARARVTALLEDLDVEQPPVAVTHHTARLGPVQGVLADRARGAEAVPDRAAGREVPDVGLLWHAVALDQLVGRITRADRGDGLDAVFARERLTEAGRIAADLGSPVDPLG
jgi:hypothetical protein